jgi:predicted signal transduction protein with EAL and GGDEF domain
VFRVRHHAPRPVVLLLVYGAFLAIVGVTATMQAVIISAYFSTTAINTIAGTDAAVVSAFANEQLSPDDFTRGFVDAARVGSVSEAMRAFTSVRGIVRAEVRALDGRVIASDAPVAGEIVPPSQDVLSAIASRTAAARFIDGGTPQSASGALSSTRVMQEFFPLIQKNEVLGVVGIWRDATPILAALDGVRRDIMIVTFGAAAVAGLILFLVFRSAQGRISRQTAALVEATRRDSLTGTLNHGALVDELALAIERLRGSTDPSIAVALVDIDNFRLLNDTHGTRAGTGRWRSSWTSSGRTWTPRPSLAATGPTSCSSPTRAPPSTSSNPPWSRSAQALRPSTSGWTRATCCRSPSAWPFVPTPNTERL